MCEGQNFRPSANEFDELKLWFSFLFRQGHILIGRFRTRNILFCDSSAVKQRVRHSSCTSYVQYTLTAAAESAAPVDVIPADAARPALLLPLLPWCLCWCCCPGAGAGAARFCCSAVCCSCTRLSTIATGKSSWRNSLKMDARPKSTILAPPTDRSSKLSLGFNSIY